MSQSNDRKHFGITYSMEFQKSFRVEGINVLRFGGGIGPFLRLKVKPAPT
jgi:hypothetical protein